MNGFEMQRQLRALNTSRPPQADLWPGIAARIGPTGTSGAAQVGSSRERPRRRRTTWRPVATAAALLLAFGGGWFLARLPSIDAIPAGAPLAATTADTLPAAIQAFTRTHGGDPRLASATLVLDAAHAELEQALAQQPDAAFLVGLLARTHAHRAQLDRYGRQAG